MTDAELQGITLQALNMAKREMEQKGEFSGLLANYFVGEAVHRMTVVESWIQENLGKDWLSHGAKKEAAFEALRLATTLRPPDAVLFVSAVNLFRSTDALHALPLPEQQALLNAGHERHHRAVEEGLLEIQDALFALAQTPQRICHYTQLLESGHFAGPPDVQFGNPAEFGGRLKLYGDPEEARERLAEFLARQGAREPKP
jgi:hypothetical protein